MERKKKITRFAMVTTLVVLIFCLFPTVLAGRPPFIQKLPGDNNLRAPWWFGEFIEDPPGSGEYYYSYEEWEFDSTEELYFRMGWGLSEEELENDWAPKNPWKYKLFINDEEINLQRYDVKAVKASGILKVSYWYHIFEPGYFIVGEEYLLRFEFWVRRPYQGDGLNHWRIYVDYWGIYFPAGTEFSFEYYLNIDGSNID